MRMAQVLIFRGVTSLFSYEASELFQVGHLVQVPFGRSLVKGLVIEIQEKDPPKHIIKQIDSLDVEKPLLISQVKLIMWMSEYYQLSPHKAFQTLLGSHLNKKAPKLPDKSETLDDPFKTPYPLSVEQTQALSEILTGALGQACLIHGITASGKTEIYIQLAHTLLTQNKQVLSKRSIKAIVEKL